MAKRSPLDDPRTSAHAWARYRKLMRWMVVFTLVVVIVALGLVYRETGIALDIISAQEEARLASRAAGMDDFIGKPVRQRMKVFGDAPALTCNFHGICLRQKGEKEPVPPVEFQEKRTDGTEGSKPGGGSANALPGLEVAET